MWNSGAHGSLEPCMVPRSLVVLGSTGSIGRSCLDVIQRHPGCFVVKALAAHASAELLIEQYRLFRPAHLCLTDPNAAAQVSAALADEPVTIASGERALIELTKLDDVDIVVNAIVGAAGLRASLETLAQGRNLALANKESLVTGGPLFPPIIERTKARILPIDSEHSAIWQALNAGRLHEVKWLILTASGGPFRTLPRELFADITVEEALNHPTWKMGRKISIDSATMVNKGLEIIEAVTLFGVPSKKIRILVHPQSIIHSMVEYVDSSVIAQLSQPDMRLPISYALFWPDRVGSEYGQIDWHTLKSLTFELPDYDKFPLLRLAFRVAEAGGTAPAIYNAANEIAAESFLNRQIKFTEIADIVTGTVDAVPVVSKPRLDDILEADRAARATARKLAENVVCS